MRRSVGALVTLAGALAGAGCGGVTAEDVDREGGSTGSGAAEVPEPVAEACPEIAAEALVCMSMHLNDLKVVSPATGKTCRFMRAPGDIVVNYFKSLVMVGGDAYRCSSAVQRISLSSGEIDDAYGRCASVSTSQGKIVVRPAPVPGDDLPRLDVFGSFEDLRDGAPEAQIAFPAFNEPMLSSFQVHTTDDTLYTFQGAWNQLQVFDFPAMTRRPDLTLQDFNRDIAGLWADVEAGTVLVLSRHPMNPQTDMKLSTFDQEDGMLLSEVTLDEPERSAWGGLTCWYNGQALR